MNTKPDRLEACPTTYPARPINGGPLDQARPKTGEWFYEPKYNGWRALIHVPTGAMFNREGKRLSIEQEFAPALAELKASPFEWLDCEGLERRHDLGRGSLIVLDVVFAQADYRQRRAWLADYFKPELGPQFIDPNRVYLPPSIEAQHASRAWEVLQKRNADCRGEFYEGLVAKRADSRYPIQLRHPKEEFSGWMKHRWAY